MDPLINKHTEPKRCTTPGIICAGMLALLTCQSISFAGEKPMTDDRKFPRHAGSQSCEKTRRDGRLGYVLGVRHTGVLRASKSEPQDEDGLGFRFNHHPMLVHWKGNFYASYQGGPTDGALSKKPPVHWLLSVSPDGCQWTKPVVLFPSVKIDGVYTCEHTRAGCNVSKQGRLLANKGNNMFEVGRFKPGQWRRIDLRLEGGKAGTFKVYTRVFPAGAVVLGGNDRPTTGAPSNYFVALAKAAARERK